MTINLKLVFITIFIISIIILTGIYVINKLYVSDIANNNSNNINTNNSIPYGTISPIGIDYNKSITVLPNDQIINNITWSLYPNLQTGYVNLVQVCEPNDKVPHKYIAIGITTEVKNSYNRTLVYEQLSCIAQEVRHICGPNTAICIFGTTHGILEWSVTMHVYDDKVYY